MFGNLFDSQKAAEAWQIFKTEFPMGVWESLYMTLTATFFAFVIGLPLGVLLATGDKNGVRPLPRPVMAVLNFIVNLLRSVPFLILMIMAFPVSELIVGTRIGTTACIVPLTIAAFPFVARLVESSIREVPAGVVEAAQSMGASPFRIVVKVLLPEAFPSLVSAATLTVTTVLGYSAMAGIIGGGGLGKIAINYGYYRYKTLVMLIAVVFLIILVQLFQSVGSLLARKSDKRLR